MRRETLCRCRRRLLDVGCWAPCCAGFGLGVVLAVFASFKIVLILSGVMLVVLAVPKPGAARIP